MVVLVIGPSGVGKSDYGKYAARMISECQFFDLDSLVHRRSGKRVSNLLPEIGNDDFLEYCQREVEELLRACTEEVAVVAVGAGALQSNHAHAWLSCHPDPTIAVVAAPDEVFRRGGKRNENRNLDEFIETEYSPYRQRLYEAAKYQCCVTGLSVEEARNCFTNMICNLITENLRKMR